MFHVLEASSQVVRGVLRAALESFRPGSLVEAAARDVDRTCSDHRRQVFEHLVLQEHPLGDARGDPHHVTVVVGALRLEVRHHDGTNRRRCIRCISVRECLGYRLFHCKDGGSVVGVVGAKCDFVEVQRVEHNMGITLAEAREGERRHTHELQIRLQNRFCDSKVFIDNAHCEKQHLRRKSATVMDRRNPVYQTLAHLPSEGGVPLHVVWIYGRRELLRPGSQSN
mmetsp:Transcript_12578/g.38574  ORF Transcript_12578/g.38574 Transcript_12578/m.38574 type:complete len:225 (-) Transcript_12578:414-1088(-)